ncbi:MAG: hypothetical protein CR990_00550 [Desulfococcus sp.]|nr:MAG: hypothetical protein CR990_00550 [Desulfococcus sp.]
MKKTAAGKTRFSGRFHLHPYQNGPANGGWRRYQSGLKNQKRRKRAALKSLRLCFLLLIMAMCAWGFRRPPDSTIDAGFTASGLDKAAEYGTAHAAGIRFKGTGSARAPSLPPPSFADTAPAAAFAPRPIPASLPDVQDLLARVHPGETREVRPSPLLTRTDLRALLDSREFTNLKKPELMLSVGGRECRVRTSLDMDLQQALLQDLDTAHSRYIGLVVMEADTGRILSLVGYDRIHPERNPCLNSIFPAASIFKIVTAAAALDRCDLRPASPLKYRGQKYTLYKFQIKKSDAPSHSISLRDAFAQSVNPVFGKLGSLHLGKEPLVHYARAFGFGEKVSFELPVPPSTFTISDDPYHLAEIASGFNRTTLISPLHGALMAAAIANGAGMMPSPMLVERITDTGGRLLYRSRPASRQVMPAGVAGDMKILMNRTIVAGTCRKVFRGYEKDPVLSRLDMGGKTGSINSRAHKGRRYDWFVGFAGDARNTHRIVVSAVVAHEKYIGTKAKTYAKKAFHRYFERIFSEEMAHEAQKNGVPLQPS